MSFVQWCCESGAKSHRKRTKKPWRKRQSRSWRYSFHKYFTTFFYLFLFFNYFTLRLFFYTFSTHDIYPHPHPRPTTSTHDPRHLATLLVSRVWGLHSLCSGGKWGLIIYSMGQENKVCSSRIGKRKRSFLFKVWLVQLVREVKHWPVTELKCLMIRTYHAEANQNTTNTKILYF